MLAHRMPASGRRLPSRAIDLAIAFPPLALRCELGVEEARHLLVEHDKLVVHPGGSVQATFRVSPCQ